MQFACHNHAEYHQKAREANGMISVHMHLELLMYLDKSGDKHVCSPSCPLLRTKIIAKDAVACKTIANARLACGVQALVAQEPSVQMVNGHVVSLSPQTAIFGTMNPSFPTMRYLPDNIQQLMWPVAMTIPDFALIAEVVLMYSGFADCKVWFADGYNISEHHLV